MKNQKLELSAIAEAIATSTRFFHFSPKSTNAKTGPIPVTTSGKQTCPKACVFMPEYNEAGEIIEGTGGCYAANNPMVFHWNKVSNGAYIDYSELCYQVATIRPARLAGRLAGLWRGNQAGDLAGDKENVDRIALQMMVDANNGIFKRQQVGKKKRGFTYTHYDVLENRNNYEAVLSANRQGFTINLSANDLVHADRLAALNIAPVATVLDSAIGRRTKRKEGWTESLPEYKARIKGLATPEGRRVVVCPATYQDDVTCADCGLCQVQGNRPLIGFPAHGASFKRVDRVIAIKLVNA